MISLSMKIQPRCSVRHQKMQTKTSVKYNLSLIRNKCKIIVKYPDTIPILRVTGKEVSNNTIKAPNSTSHRIKETIYEIKTNSRI